MMWWSRALAYHAHIIAIAACFIFSYLPTLSAQTSQDHLTIVQGSNEGAIGIVLGGRDRANLDMALDLMMVTNAQSKLRVVPIIGQGDWQNIVDVLYLKGVDIALVQSDVLSYFKSQSVDRDVSQRLVYIAQLYVQEFHLLAGENIRSIRDLAGKTVNFGLRDSGGAITAGIIFSIYGIDIMPVYLDQVTAVEKIRSGEIAATAQVGPKPSRSISQFTRADGVHLLPVNYHPSMQNLYTPSEISSNEYPTLIKAEESIGTVAVPVVMLTYNWKSGSDRYTKVQRFVEAFFSGLNSFAAKTRREKWNEANLTVTLSGWTRFSGAQEWLKANRQSAETELRDDFRKFLQESVLRQGRLSKEEGYNLFSQFLKWRKEKGGISD